MNTTDKLAEALRTIINARGHYGWSPEVDAAIYAGSDALAAHESAPAQPVEPLAEEPIFHLRSYGDVTASQLAEYAQGAQPKAEPAQPVATEPVAWAITYDGRAPYELWGGGDGPLLDLEVKRLGGTAQKMPLYTTPQPKAAPLSDEQIDQLADPYVRELGGGAWYSGDDGVRDDDLIAFARAIEAAHGIAAAIKEQP